MFGTKIFRSSKNRGISRKSRRPWKGLQIESLEKRELMTVGWQLDASFSGGQVTTDFGGDEVATDFAVQGNIAYIVGITSVGGSDTNYAIAAHRLYDGQLHAPFQGGTVVTDIDFDFNHADSVAIQPDGKIVVAGDSGLVRYRTDGLLDQSFGNSGKSEFPSFYGMPDVKIDAHGRINVLRHSGLGESQLLSYTPNADAFDPIFVDENVLYDATAMSIQDNGNVLVAGSWSGEYGEDEELRVVRYDASSGAPDSSYGSGHGFAFAKLKNGWANATSTAIDRIGRLIVGAYMKNDTGAVCRFLNNGLIDSNFDADGCVTTDFHVVEVLEENDGNIVAVGKVDNHVVIAEYGQYGKLISKHIGSDTDNFPAGAAFQEDGKLLVAGTIGGDFQLMRFNPVKYEYVGTPVAKYNWWLDPAILETLFGGQFAESSDLLVTESIWWQDAEFLAKLEPMFPEVVDTTINETDLLAGLAESLRDYRRQYAGDSDDAISSTASRLEDISGGGGANAGSATLDAMDEVLAEVSDLLLVYEAPRTTSRG